MVFGNPLRERIQFNDSSLWTGGANPSGGYEVNEFGCYQNFGDLYLEMESGSLPEGSVPEGFSRTLNLADGIHRTIWKQAETTFTREVFASHPDQVIIVRITADQPGKVAGKLKLPELMAKPARPSEPTTAFSGALANGLRYAARVDVSCDGGKVTDLRRRAFLVREFRDTRARRRHRLRARSREKFPLGRRSGRNRSANRPPPLRAKITRLSRPPTSRISKP